MRRPFDARYASTSRVNDACNSSGVFRPSRAIRARHCGHRFQSRFSTSSPPMWIHFEGKSAIVSSRTLFTNAVVEGLPAHIATPCSPAGTPSHFSQGKLCSAGCACPGISISGTTVTCRRRANSTTRRISAFV